EEAAGARGANWVPEPEKDAEAGLALAASQKLVADPGLALPGWPDDEDCARRRLLDAHAKGELERPELMLAPDAGGGSAEGRAGRVDGGLLALEREDAIPMLPVVCDRRDVEARIEEPGGHVVDPDGAATQRAARPQQGAGAIDHLAEVAALLEQ